MSRPRACLLAAGLAALCAAPAAAQFRFRLEGCDGEVTFGRPFAVLVERAWPADASPQPFDEAALQPLELRLLAAGVEPEGGLLVERRRYEAVAVRTGELWLGPFVVRAVDGDGQAHAAEFAAVVLRVASTLPDPPGPVEWPGDVRDRMPPRRGWLWLFALAVPVLAVLAWLRPRRTPVAAVEPPPPGPSPAERARAEFAALGGFDGGAAAALAYHTEVVEILRRFTRACFGLRSETRTSQELVAAVDRGSASLRRCLHACDLVKFAAAATTPESAAGCVGAALDFVQAAEASS